MIQVLLVEDEPAHRLLIGDMLAGSRRGKFELHQASSLEEGLRQLALQSFDLILTDLGLPDSRELNTLVGLRSAAAETPIVALSASDDEQVALRAIQSGAQDYLVKSVLNAEVLERVAIYAIERNRIRQELRLAEKTLLEANRSALSEYQRLLNRIADLEQELGTAHDLPGVFRGLLDFLLASVPCNGLFVSLYAPERQERTCVYAWSEGQEEDISTLPPLPMTDSPASRAVSTGEIIVTDDFGSAVAGKPVVNLGFDRVPRLPASSIAVPLVVMGRVLGAFEIQSVEPAAYRQEHVTALRMAANIAAIAIENVRLLETEYRLRVEAEASEGRFRDLVQGLDAIVWEGDVATERFTFVSQQAEALLGYPTEQWLTEQDFWLSHIHPDDRDRARLHKGAAHTSSNSYAIEYRMLTADGKIVSLRDTVRVARDEQGRPRQLRGVMVDVTAHKRAEQSLRARTHQQEAIATLGQQALAAYDLPRLMESAAVLVASTLEVEFCKVLELLPDGQELLLRAGVGWQPGLVGRATVGGDLSSQAGYTLFTGAPVIVADLRLERRFSAPALLFDHGVVSGISVVINTPEGPFGVLGAHTTSRRVFTELDVNFLQAAANILGTAIEKARAEQTLRSSEARSRAFLEALPGMLFRMDRQGVFLDFRPANNMVTFTPPELFLGRGVHEVLPPDVAALTALHLQRTLETGETHTFEYALPMDGVQYFEARMAVSGPDEVLSIVHNVTDRKRVEEEHLAREAAEKANEAKSEFLAHMSHELRTPLNAILGFSQLLEMGDLKPEERESVAYIDKAGRHLLEVINEVLDIARVEVGRLSISPEPTLLEEVLSECLELTSQQVTHRGIRLAIDPPGRSSHVVLADRQRLKQVLLNLLSNAVKYNHAGGSINIEFRREQSGTRLLISDTGAGIPPAKLARLFTPFDRLGAEAGAVEGTGLGLVISKRLIEAMGGRIGVESVAGAGSTFWVELPEAAPQPGRDLAWEDEVGALVQPPAPGGSGETRTMLYIEDNPVSLSLVERLVERRPNIRLLSAHSGLGFELARQQQVDLVLLDLHLPEISGEEVLRRLKADPLSREIPVVILSADASAVTISRLLDSGAHDFLTKPLDVTRFLRMLDELPGLVGSCAPG